MQIRELLKSVTSDAPPEAAVDEFVHFCRKTALVLLRKKVSAGRLSLGHIALSLDDLALDCVADLFSRNSEGQFVQLQVYTRGIDPDKLSEAELMSHMRRLIFAKVNHGIFRIYHDIDPSLSRIIRNIKISIHALENYMVVDRFGEPYLLPSACDPLEHLPVADPEQLKNELRKKAGPSETIPGLLAHLSRTLREDETRCRMIPLVQAALIFRWLYTGTETTGAPAAGAEDALIVSDAGEIVREVCAWVKERAHRKYVAGGKVCEEMFGHYFHVVEAAVLRMVTDRDGVEVSYFEELKKLVPDLSRDEYRRSHRGKIEYIGRIVHRRAVRELRKHF